ncbi:hypothetical protein HanXRQr2_Chr13g0581951 [Helianthus annuus]|uniref:Uncharacterized protein n=1 Tax=Helianthus annuus TaxID=4232 RepID=A0A9K3HBY1_HELAN|nr:hypothetical protein HanXRQr2_Chr13g0581951 [Helianthus annuus]KAJ0848656.1 hypothetical protein HanPSC8_Chr13g0560081 [Helianthus annuus]
MLDATNRVFMPEEHPKSAIMKQLLKKTSRLAISIIVCFIYGNALRIACS